MDHLWLTVAAHILSKYHPWEEWARENCQTIAHGEERESLNVLENCRCHIPSEAMGKELTKSCKVQVVPSSYGESN